MPGPSAGLRPGRVPYRTARAGGRRGQRGVALVIVLWCLAGMTVLVGAIVLQGRSDTQLAQIHISRARASAAGDAAIQLLFADRLPGGSAARNAWQANYRVGETAVSVLALPAQLLVDLNGAEEALLSRTLAQVGAGEAAQLLAGAIVQWRAPGAGSGLGARRFETVEDLLQVEGFHRALWASLRDFLTARREVSGQASDAAGTAGLLRIVAAVSPERRAAQPQLLADLSPGAIPQARGPGVYRVDALMREGGRVWLRRAWVDSGSRAEALPWSVLRREPPRIVPVARG